MERQIPRCGFESRARELPETNGSQRPEQTKNKPQVSLGMYCYCALEHAYPYHVYRGFIRVLHVSPSIPEICQALDNQP